MSTRRLQGPSNACQLSPCPPETSKKSERPRDQEPCERLHGCSKGPRLVRPVDVHEEVAGSFQCLPVESMSIRNVQNRPRDQEPCERLRGCCKSPRLVRPVDVHEKVPGPFQRPPSRSTSTGNVQFRPKGPGDRATCVRPRPRFLERRSLAVVILEQKVPPEVTEPAEPFRAGKGRVICSTMTLFEHPNRRQPQV